MRYLEGLHPAEIASITGLTANVVSVRLHRALKDISKAAQARKDAMRQRNVAAFVPQKRNSTMK
jgi:DNA-directed RNA polymerase specialized sigma24 family protein